MTSESAALVLRPEFNASGPERPVFLDESGRRARVVRHGGRLLGVATAAWLAALVLGASPGQTLPPLSVQLASIRSVTVSRVASAHGPGRHSIASQMSFARLTTRPDANAAIAHATADVEARAARRI
jgi:hypothetical protein